MKSCIDRHGCCKCQYQEKLQEIAEDVFREERKISDMNMVQSLLIRFCNLIKAKSFHKSKQGMDERVHTLRRERKIKSENLNFCEFSQKI